MNIDWNKTAHEPAIHHTTKILRSSASTGLESTAAAPYKSDGDRIKQLRDAIGQSTEGSRANSDKELIAHVISGAQSGLAKLENEEPVANFTLKEEVGLEAVILTSGERPSLIVKEGFIDLGAPDIGQWKADLQQFQDKIKSVIASVGRINIPISPGFIGTCFVIASGFVLTNRHVLEDIAKAIGDNNWQLNWPDATTIDFYAEDGASKATGFRITGVAYAGPYPINNIIDFAHLDAAILRVDATDSAGLAFPKAVVFEKDLTMPSFDRNFYVLGFAGRPLNWYKDGAPLPGFETVDVLTRLFQQKFGIKRLAPGRVTTGVGQIVGDQQHWVFSHDASTLGGNSGSCVVDLSEDGLRVLGLHFGGSARAQNWAHAASHLSEQLGACSAQFVS